MAKQIVIDHVFKVFGDDPPEALALVRQGLSKQEVLARTGQSIGVFDAHLSIEAGEIFVVMGLSGSGKSTLVRLLNLLIEPSAGRILVDGVDIAQLEDAFVREDGAWTPLSPDPSRRTLLDWSDFSVWAIPLDDLIDYKTRLGRTADVEDLRRLA